MKMSCDLSVFAVSISKYSQSVVLPCRKDASITRSKQSISMYPLSHRMQVEFPIK
jgi:hypothetical protein